MVSKPSDSPSATAAVFVSTTALNCMARNPASAAHFNAYTPDLPADPASARGGRHHEAGSCDVRTATRPVRTDGGCPEHRVTVRPNATQVDYDFLAILISDLADRGLGLRDPAGAAGV
jgi:hypothetical protein